MLLVFGILFLMCSSFVEALLFILTIGMAVIINLGTNAMLPSVSMMTNTIVAVLQFVLSMDYSIILMNRLRQELGRGYGLDDAMVKAIKGASSSILSSSLTTIVGLLALVFMKFKIGLDLGVVLAKGVLCSLITIYTILPALIVMCWKGISATSKKVFLLPTDRLSRFEMRFRAPLAVLFVVIFALSAFLSTKTELSYASIWESEINDEFPPQNMFSLLYRTEDEDKMISVLDRISSEDGVQMVLSYPSLLKKQHTCGEMLDEIASLVSLMPGAENITIDSTLLNEQTLGILYYAYSHPSRKERMSFDDIITLAENVSKSGMLPPGFLGEEMDISSLMKEYQEVPNVETVADVAPVKDVASTEVKDTVIADSVAVMPDVQVQDADSTVTSATVSERFTRKNCTEPLTSEEMADFLGFSQKQASTAFAMAGAKGKNAKMSPIDFIHYMTGSVIPNKLLRKMIKNSQIEELYECEKEMEAVLEAEQLDTLSVIVPDETVPDVVVTVPDVVAETVVPAVETPPVIVVEEEPDPMAELALMYASGEKYSAEKVYRSLKKAGIKGIDRNTVDLMFLYYGSIHSSDSTATMCIEDMVGFLSEAVSEGGLFSAFIPEEFSGKISGIKDAMAEGIGSLRTDDLSMAALVTSYPLEARETFDFIERSSSVCSETLGQDFYLIGESVMYKEMRDGFRKELLIVTLITIFSIFLIVLLTFHSLLIPVILILTVLTGVYVNVAVSGIGGRPMLYLAYLIVQSILMGSTIDYGILFTNYYRENRRSGLSPAESLKMSYRGSIHTIMTSGMIIVFAAYLMSVLMDDPTICSILSSLSYGAVAAIFMILLVLPGVLAACDRLVVRLPRK